MLLVFFFASLLTKNLQSGKIRQGWWNSASTSIRICIECNAVKHKTMKHCQNNNNNNNNLIYTLYEVQENRAKECNRLKKNFGFCLDAV